MGAGAGLGWRGGRHHQRGVSGLFMVILLGLLLLFAALSVDTGRLVYAKRQLQLIADTAALDAARATGACSAQTITNAVTVLAAAQTAAARGRFLGGQYVGNLGAAPNSVTLGAVTTDGTGVRTFTQVADLEDAQAVRVVLDEAVTPSILLPGIYGRSATRRLVVTSVARLPAQAGLGVGSFLVSVNTAQSAVLNRVLGGLLGSGTALALDAAAYNGLAATSVSLADLIAADGGIGTVNELLDLNLSLRDFITLAGTAAQAGNPTAAGIVLNQLAANVGLNANVLVGDILGVALPDPNAGAAAEVNLFDLLTAGIQLANRGNLVNIPGIAVNLAPLLTVDVGLRVIEAPRLAVGRPGLDSDGDWRTEARTSQVALNLTARGASVTVPLLGLLNLSTAANLNVFVQAAQSRAHLRTLTCGGVTAPVHRAVIGAEPGIARIGLGQPTNPADPYSSLTPTGLLTLSASVILLGSTTINAQLGADVPLAAATPQNLSFTVDDRIPGPLPQTQRVGSSLASSLAGATNTLFNTLTLNVVSTGGTGLLGSSGGLLNFLGLGNLGALASALLAPVTNLVVQPLINVLSTAVIDPLLRLLGVDLGGADVRLISVDVAQPELVL